MCERSAAQRIATAKDRLLAAMQQQIDVLTECNNTLLSVVQDLEGHRSDDAESSSEDEAQPVEATEAQLKRAEWLKRAMIGLPTAE